MVLRRAVEQTQRSGPAAIGILLAEKMSQYASLLASQGSLSTAITYLPDNTNQVWDTSGVGLHQHHNLTNNCYCIHLQISLHYVSFGPNRLPYSSFVTASFGLSGSRRRRRWRRRLQQLRHKPTELRLSSLPRLRIGPSTRSPLSSLPWCLGPQQLLRYPSLRPLPPHLHSRSITSPYVQLSLLHMQVFFLFRHNVAHS